MNGEKEGGHQLDGYMGWWPMHRSSSTRDHCARRRGIETYNLLRQRPVQGCCACGDGHPPIEMLYQPYRTKSYPSSSFANTSWFIRICQDCYKLFCFCSSGHFSRVGINYYISLVTNLLYLSGRGNS